MTQDSDDPEICLHRLGSCYKFCNDTNFPIAAYFPCPTTPEADLGLRSAVKSTISAHHELLNKAEIEHLLHESNGVAFRPLKEKAK